MTRTIARLIFWTVLAAVALVTLSPIRFRPDTGLPPQVERFGAFLLAGALVSVAYPGGRRRWAAALVLAAAGLEAMQGFVPGRDAHTLDFVVKAAGACVGVGLVAAAERLRRRA